MSDATKMTLDVFVQLIRKFRADAASSGYGVRNNPDNVTYRRMCETRERVFSQCAREVVEAAVPLVHPLHTNDCGTRYRGCSPDCVFEDEMQEMNKDPDGWRRIRLEHLISTYRSGDEAQ